MAENFTLRIPGENGDATVVELTPEQLLDALDGKPVTYFPRDERLFLTEDGDFVEYESAVPDGDRD